MIAGMMFYARLFLSMSLCLAVPLVAHAQDMHDSSLGEAPRTDERFEAPESRLDSLFAELALARTSDEANVLAGRINRELGRSESATISLLMDRAVAAIGAKDYPLALDLLDSVILLAPTFAEGWNKRATVYYLQDDFNLALNDIEQTLRLEPRHYGALLGFGIIMQNFDRKAMALKIFRKVLEIYPHNETAESRVKDLSKEVEGVPL